MLARRVKEARNRRGWTQEQLAKRLEKLGYPLPRSTLAKIEKGGTRSDARLGDVLALAAALDVAPVHLIVPLEDEATLTIASKVPPVPALLAREWIRGELPLPIEPDINFARPHEIPRSELRRRVKRRVTRGMSGLEQGLIGRDRIEAEVDRAVEEILNPEREEDDNG